MGSHSWGSVKDMTSWCKYVFMNIHLAPFLSKLLHCHSRMLCLDSNRLQPDSTNYPTLDMTMLGLTLWGHTSHSVTSLRRLTVRLLPPMWVTMASSARGISRWGRGPMSGLRHHCNILPLGHYPSQQWGNDKPSRSCPPAQCRVLSPAQAAAPWSPQGRWRCYWPRPSCDPFLTVCNNDKKDCCRYPHDSNYLVNPLDIRQYLIGWSHLYIDEIIWQQYTMFQIS